MKIVVITDVHRNSHSLSAVLNDIETEKPDLIVGAGDMVGCSAYIGAIDVWSILEDMKIPFVMGNEEDRIIRLHNPSSEPYLRESVQFKPLQFRAMQFSTNHNEEMRALPLHLLLEGPRNQNVFICHVSPHDIHRSPWNGIDPQMEKELHAVNSQVVIFGHHHMKWH
ncbi:MAG: metallophosphoesterase family protein [Anaerolineales bacterium]|nr:metallophosphoesterase family protein [Anaerolineales bacterium]MBS3752734.1 metallophosphoesterase family protein [Anaerolineales bacterium]